MQTRESGQLKEVNAANMALIEPRNFIKRWFEYLSKGLTNMEAYEKTEKDYSEVYSKNKYSCYNSFRNVKDNMYKSNRL